MAAKRPKDMTAAELAALPVLRPWEIDGPIGPHERDDIVLWADVAGDLWRFIQRADGSWAKVRQARTE